MVEQRNRFEEGDVLEVICPDSIGLSFSVKNLQNSRGEAVSAAPHPQEIVTMDCPFPLQEGDILRKR